MNFSKKKIESIENEIIIQFYEYSLSVLQQEIDSEFYTLKSLQDPSVDLKIKRILQLSNGQQQETLRAFIKRRYQLKGFSGFELSQYEQKLVCLIEAPRPYSVYPDDFYDVDKLAEYEQKKRLGKKINRRTLFTRLKKKLEKDLNLNVENGYYTSIFNIKITEKVRLTTRIDVDTNYYHYSHDIYIDNNRIRLLINYLSIINFPSNWFIYQEEDIEIALNIIWGCFQQFIPKIDEVVNSLEL